MIIEDELRSNHVTKRGMRYKCQTCGNLTVMWLEKGLEEGGATQKPVPFSITCPYCGEFWHGMEHVYWRADIHLPEYMPIKEGHDYFKNDPNHECGIPVFADNVSYQAAQVFEDTTDWDAVENRERLRKLQRRNFKKGGNRR